MKVLYKCLILLVSFSVICAWFKINLASPFRGGGAATMLEEFEAYGLNFNIMVMVGISKVTTAVLLLVGLYFKEKLVVPAATVMGFFMLAAIYFHISINDPIIPTVPSTLMLISCVGIIILNRKLDLKS